MKVDSKRIIGVVMLVILTLGVVGYAQEAKAQEINLMTWGGDFIPRAIIDEFEKETKIKVNYKEVTSNEDMQSLLQANPDQYDLAVVTDYMIDIMRQSDLLAVLDRTQLSNYANINPVYQGRYYDEQDQFAIPYAISTSFLLVNPEEVAKLGANPITGYGDLWQKELKNNVVIVDWSVEVIGVVLKALGYEYNETDPAIVAEAREKLFALKPNIMRFETNTPEDSLVNGEAVAGFMYSNQAAKGQAANSKLEPVFPHEGMPIFIDAFVMSKKAPNKEGAYKFLNFLLQPEIAARIADLTKFTSPNKAAEAYLPEDFKNNPMLNIADDVMKNTSFYVGVDKVLEEYDYIYSEFKLR